MTTLFRTTVSALAMAAIAPVGAPALATDAATAATTALAGGIGSVTPDVQTVTVAPGGATMTGITFEVSGACAIVDHALSRAEKGLVGHIKVEGAENPAIFAETAPAM